MWEGLFYYKLYQRYYGTTDITKDTAKMFWRFYNSWSFGGTSWKRTNSDGNPPYLPMRHVLKAALIHTSSASSAVFDTFSSQNEWYLSFLLFVVDLLSLTHLIDLIYLIKVIWFRVSADAKSWSVTFVKDFKKWK